MLNSSFYIGCGQSKRHNNGELPPVDFDLRRPHRPELATVTCGRQNGSKFDDKFRHCVEATNQQRSKHFGSSQETRVF
jgi:hypothetical protein